jgi:hypothetical protein
MSKFIAFVAALLVSTLSFAQQFITFSNKPIEVKEGQLYSISDNLYTLNSKVDSSAHHTANLYAVVDLKMTLEEILKEGYSVNISVLSNVSQSQLDSTGYSLMEIGFVCFGGNEAEEPSYLGSASFTNNERWGDYADKNIEVLKRSHQLIKAYEDFSCEFEIK